jgi:hypothetical protein
VNNGLYDEADTISVIYNNSGRRLTIDTDSLVNWQAGGGWDITSSTYYSAPTSITDSPFGNYSDDETNTITLKEEIDLNDAQLPVLTFYAKWQLERDFDFVVVEASKNGGVSWTPLCGKYTKAGSVNQIKDEPIYDGDFMNEWLREVIPLDDYINQKIKIRFRLVADQFVNYDGFYFDDVEVLGVSDVSAINEKEDLAAYLKVVPNPAADWIAIYQKNGIQSFEVRNALGEVIINDVNTSVSNQVNVSVKALPNGVYFLTTVNAEGIQHQTRFVKGGN